MTAEEFRQVEKALKEHLKDAIKDSEIKERDFLEVQMFESIRMRLINMDGAVFSNMQVYKLLLLPYDVYKTECGRRRTVLNKGEQDGEILL